MIKSIIIVPCLLVILTSLNSCSHYYYAPNSHNVPLFQKEKEARIRIALSQGLTSLSEREKHVGVEIQGAYSITKNIGIMVNGFFVKSQSANNDDVWGKGSFIEFGSGYFKQLINKSVFEIYAGIGRGTVTNQYDVTRMTSTVNFTRYFIQPSIGMHSKGFDFAFSPRFCGLNFNKIAYKNNIYQGDKQDLEYMKNNEFSFLFEPAVTIRAGGQHFKLQGQMVYSHNVSNPKLAQGVFNFNVGVLIII